MSPLTPSEALAVLRSCAVFAALPADTLAVLSEIVRTERFAAGQEVCRVGEPAGEVYVVASGQLDVTLPGRNAPVRTMGFGEIFGEYGMFGRRVRTTTVVARTDTVVLSLEYPRFREFLLAFPASALELLELAVARMAEPAS